MVSEVRMTTCVEPDGIRYRVKRGDVVLWERFVRFGKGRRNRAGSAAFIEAAREQQREASRYSKGGEAG